MEYEERFIDLRSDFGFKHIFGTDRNKHFLLHLLNAILFGGQQKISGLIIKNNEQLGESKNQRKILFDIHCESSDNERMIIEMQLLLQPFFIDRTVFYTSNAIREQAQRGKSWDYKLNPVYTISFVNFPITNVSPKKVKHTVQLKDDEGRLFYDKLLLVFLEMPNFSLSVKELKTDEDKWLYIIKNLTQMKIEESEIKTVFTEKIFVDLFMEVEIANLNAQDMAQHNESIMIYRDTENAIVQYGRNEAEKAAKEAAKETNYKIVNNLLKKNLSVEFIAEVTGLPIKEVLKLKSKFEKSILK